MEYDVEIDEDDLQYLGNGAAITFLVPSPLGCGYACPGCIFVLQNNPLLPRSFDGKQLTPAKIKNLIEGFIERSVSVPGAPGIIALTIQGVQPFQEGLSRKCSVMILREGFHYDIPVSYVSSGDGVPECLDVITEVRASSCISIDAERKTNNRIRPAVLPDGSPDPNRKSYDVAIEALRALATQKKLHDRIFVGCVVLPGKPERPFNLLEQFPDDLFPHVQFIFSPWIATRGAKAGTTGITRDQFLDTADQILELNEMLGVPIYFDDEFGALDLVNHMDRKHLLPRGAWQTIRVYPNGKVQQGGDLLSNTENAPVFKYTTDEGPVFG